MSLVDLALSIPWLMESQALEALLSIAAREPLSEDAIKERMHGPKALTLRNGKRRDDGGRMTMREGVALIPIDGPIYRYADYFTSMSGGITTEALAKQLQAAIDDSAVQAILFVIDSPGGEATGINELSEAIYAARSKKTVWAYVEGYGASAAYWIASAADTVVIDDTALLGSIGTVLGVPDPTKRTRFTIEIVSTQSPKKRPDVTTEEGRAVVQQIADGLTDVFIAKVARNRSITADQILAIEGGMLIGAAAVAAGLADQIGSEEGCVAALLAQIATSPFRRPPEGVRLPQRREGLSMNVFSREWWGNLIAGAADAGQQPDAQPGQLVQGELLQAVAAPLQLLEASLGTSAAAMAAPGQADPAMAAEIDKLKAQIETQRLTQVARDAEAFAAAAVRDRRAMPAESNALIALYTRAANDDHAAPMSEGEPTRRAQLESLVSSRPQHSLTTEQVKVGAGGVLESGAETRMSETRRKELLNATPLGQAAIKQAKSA